jgi:hypothetical protein
LSIEPWFQISSPQNPARFFWRYGCDFLSAILPYIMSGRKKKKEERPVFDSIRKPTAPPGHKFGGDKPEEKIHPAGRKIKHKRPKELEE